MTTSPDTALTGQPNTLFIEKYALDSSMTAPKTESGVRIRALQTGRSPSRPRTADCGVQSQGESANSRIQPRALLPYFRVRSVFDPGAGAALAPPIPRLADYFGSLMDYARVARWGKTPLPCWKRRPEATRAAA